MRKIGMSQGVARACQSDSVHDPGTFSEAPETVQGSGVRADAQCCKITWLEELASESNTIQAQEDISVSGVIAGKYPVKLCVVLGQLFVHISGLASSFGLVSFVERYMVSLLQWIAAGPSRKSI